MDNNVINWPAVKDYVGIIKEIIVALAALSAAIFAYLGLSTWRKELKGKSEYEKAKDVLKAVYKVREGFKHVRNPAIWSYEYPEEMRDHWGHLKRGTEYEGTAHVYEQRWKILSEAFNDLEEKTLEAQVEWGPEFENVIRPLRECRAELMVTLQMKLERKKHPEEFSRITEEERQKETSVLNYLGNDSEHDKFTPRINAAIAEFEKKLRPHIQR
ncbi:MAG: hypothetical protein FD156_1885 [Nitrospirae bacterium]|nr:MAG: hypothetical protein FD156_1885 [Nitrospirota bacterium]